MHAENEWVKRKEKSLIVTGCIRLERCGWERAQRDLHRQSQHPVHQSQSSVDTNWPIRAQYPYHVIIRVPVMPIVQPEMKSLSPLESCARFLLAHTNSCPALIGWDWIGSSQWWPGERLREVSVWCQRALVGDNIGSCCEPSGNISTGPSLELGDIILQWHSAGHCRNT